MTTTQRITTTTAAILSLAAAGAPTATAQHVGGNPATTANRAPATVYSRPDKSVIAVTKSHRAPATVYSRPDKSVIAVTTPYGRRVPQPASTPQAVVRIQAPPSGFDWGDAGIGAAGGVALAMLGLGGALAVSQRHPRRPRKTTSVS